MATNIISEINSKTLFVVNGNLEVETALKSCVYSEGGHCVTSFFDLCATKTISENILHGNCSIPNYECIMDKLDLVDCANKYPKDVSALERRKTAYAKSLLSGYHVLFFKISLEELTADARLQLIVQLKDCCELTSSICVFFIYDGSNDLQSCIDQYEPFDAFLNKQLPIEKYFCI